MTTAFLAVVVLFLAVACTEKKHDKIDAITDRAAFPRMKATEVTTVVSDSGITRYRITAPEWNIYDKAIQPYWEFPKGIHIERFDLSFNVDANIHSNYARFLENEQIWELKGNVRATNIIGELFETEQLFWNQRDEKFYSDSLIKITQTTRIITGEGFDSNQSMTQYTIRKGQAVLPFKE
jgi:LPS export ABC transporter protein LptC